jgi:hypothetical protein
MKYKILLYGLVAAMATSCSSAYKASQTPDDVYFSPARAAGVEKETTKKAKRNDYYEDYTTVQDDQYLRMKIRNRQRWSSIDDYAYWNDTRYTPYYSYNYYRDNWLSPYTWTMPYNSYSIPFYSSGYYPYNYYPQYGYGAGVHNTYIIKNPTRSVNTTRPSLNGYKNNVFNNNNNNNPGNFGNTLKRVFTPSNNEGYSNRNSSNNTNNTYTAPTRTYSPPASSGSSSGSSSSGGGGVTRPPRN